MLTIDKIKVTFSKTWIFCFHGREFTYHDIILRKNLQVINLRVM